MLRVRGWDGECLWLRRRLRQHPWLPAPPGGHVAAPHAWQIPRYLPRQNHQPHHSGGREKKCFRYEFDARIVNFSDAFKILTMQHDMIILIITRYFWCTVMYPQLLILIYIGCMYTFLSPLEHDENFLELPTFIAIWQNCISKLIVEDGL